MRRFFTLFLAIALSFLMIFMVGCIEQEEPTYAENYSFDESYHWRAQINGDGFIEYEAHVNNKGRCKCGKYFECKELLYSLKDGELTCLGDNDINSFLNYKHVEVPAFAEYLGENYPVTAISNYAFKNEIIETIKLNDGLLAVGSQAFAYTISLKEIVIPDSVKTYGGSITYEAKGLERFVFGNGCKKVPNYNFYGCPKLKQVVIPDSVVELGVVAFTGNTSLEYLVIPDSVTSIAGHRQFFPDIVPGDDFGPSFNTAGVKIFMEHEAPLENFRVGWNASGDFYFKGEWQYDENGVPQPL